MAAKVGPDRWLCPGCDQVKPGGEYYEQRDKHNGIGTYCRDCHRERQRENRRRAAETASVMPGELRRATK